MKSRSEIVSQKKRSIRGSNSSTSRSNKMRGTTTKILMIRIFVFVKSRLWPFIQCQCSRGPIFQGWYPFQRFFPMRFHTVLPLTKILHRFSPCLTVNCALCRTKTSFRRRWRLSFGTQSNSSLELTTDSSTFYQISAVYMAHSQWSRLFSLAGAYRTVPRFSWRPTWFKSREVKIKNRCFKHKVLCTVIRPFNLAAAFSSE